MLNNSVNWVFASGQLWSGLVLCVNIYICPRCAAPTSAPTAPSTPPPRCCSPAWWSSQWAWSPRSWWEGSSSWQLSRLHSATLYDVNNLPKDKHYPKQFYNDLISYCHKQHDVLERIFQRWTLICYDEKLTEAFCPECGQFCIIFVYFCNFVVFIKTQ